jgi:hypothetical protein
MFRRSMLRSQREHRGEATAVLPATFLDEAIRLIILIVGVLQKPAEKEEE